MTKKTIKTIGTLSDTEKIEEYELQLFAAKAAKYITNSESEPRWVPNGIKEEVLRAKYRKVFLIGFMGSGKTTVGQLLAKRLRIGFLDTDQVITAKMGMDIPSIFSELGENAFRYAEHRFLFETIMKHRRLIIATGGGMPCSFSNMATMRAAGPTIYLKRSHDQLYELLKSETHYRPLLADSSDLKATISEMLTLREPHYNLAHFVLDIAADETVEQVVKRVISILES